MCSWGYRERDYAHSMLVFVQELLRKTSFIGLMKVNGGGGAGFWMAGARSVPPSTRALPFFLSSNYFPRAQGFFFPLKRITSQQDLPCSLPSFHGQMNE
jgi:hypothetical protein